MLWSVTGSRHRNAVDSCHHFKVYPKFFNITSNNFDFQGFSIGIGITYPLCGFLIAHLGWRSVFYTTGTIGVLWCVFWYLLAFDSPESHPRITESEMKYIHENTVNTFANSKVKYRRVLCERLRDVYDLFSVAAGAVVVDSAFDARLVHRNNYVREDLGPLHFYHSRSDVYEEYSRIQYSESEFFDSCRRFCIKYYFCDRTDCSLVPRSSVVTCHPSSFATSRISWWRITFWVWRTRGRYLRLWRRWCRGCCVCWSATWAVTSISYLSFGLSLLLL